MKYKYNNINHNSKKYIFQPDGSWPTCKRVLTLGLTNATMFHHNFPIIIYPLNQSQSLCYHNFCKIILDVIHSLNVYSKAILNQTYWSKTHIFLKWFLHPNRPQSPGTHFFNPNFGNEVDCFWTVKLHRRKGQFLSFPVRPGGLPQFSSPTQSKDIAKKANMLDKMTYRISEFAIFYLMTSDRWMHKQLYRPTYVVRTWVNDHCSYTFFSSWSFSKIWIDL